MTGEKWRENLAMSLRPCPFCGGQAIIDPIFHEARSDYQWIAKVFCRDCGGTAVSAGFERTAEDAVVSATRNWNTRYYHV